METNSLLAKLFITEDGSSSLFVPDLNEPYHSRHGAITESLHIYISHGLNTITLKNISVFELGFGTGLNAFVTYIHGLKSRKKISYTCIELYPVSLDLARNLNYPALLDVDHQKNFLKLHESKWNKKIRLSSDFIFKKVNANFTSFDFKEKYDLIYFDAFAPSVQPDLWTQEIFDKIYEAMNPGAILVTYCAMGLIRRRLITAGFQVKRLPGPPGKREIIQANKP